jgi:acetyl esterase/lipase
MGQPAPPLVQWLAHFNQVKEEMLKAGFTPTATNAREALAGLTFGLVTERPAISWTRDDLVKAAPYNVPVRIYHPEYNQPLPVLVFVHGGGHMAGGISVYDAISRKLALATHHIVVCPDYRLAPECPYPAAVIDAFNVAKNVLGTLDRRGLPHEAGLRLCGDSGGGALCATVAHLAQHDPGLKILRQVLIYPSLDYTLQWPSVQANGRGYLLEKERILWYFDNYFQRAENRRAVSPLHMEFTPRLPETMVLTAEFCPLRDEGRAYVEKLKATGVYTEQRHFDDMIHAFLNMENLVPAACASAYRAIGEFLNRPPRTAAE